MSHSSELKEILSSDDPEILKVYLSRQPDISQRELDQTLVSVMLEGSLDTIKTLFQHGSKLTVSSTCHAIVRQDPALFQILLDRGWDIDSTEFGRSPVHMALCYEISLRWLLEHGANPNIVSKRPRGSCAEICTPLVTAAKIAFTKGTSALKILLSRGARIDPLAMASAITIRVPGDGIAAIGVLLDHGADINYVTERRGTVLSYAVTRNKKDTVRFLLGRGADATIRNSRSGMSAIDWAKKLGNLELYDLLQGTRVDGNP